MKTDLLDIDEYGLAEAARIIAQGGLVAFPTETVYGLGANAYDEAAVRSIFVAKGRPSDNPLIVHIGDKAQLYEVASDVPLSAQKLAERFFPGSLTMVLPKNPRIPDIVTAGLNSVGIRFPLSEEARSFLRAVRLPIAAPSANTSSRPSPTRAIDVLRDMDGKIPLVLNGSDCSVGIESTVLDLSRGKPIILRRGVVTAPEIEEVIGERVYIAGENITAKVNSPGVKYKHYAPKIPLYLSTDCDRERVVAFAKAHGRVCLLLPEGMETDYAGFPSVNMGNNSYTYARRLYSALRDTENDYDSLIALFPFTDDMAESVLNRLHKASGGKNIE